METIQLLGSLGEFVGAIAVVATLVYLAIQVRHGKDAMDANTKSLDESRRLAVAQAYQARAEMLQDAVMRQADSPYSAAISLKLQNEGMEALTAEERWRMGAHLPVHSGAPCSGKRYERQAVRVSDPELLGHTPFATRGDGLRQSPSIARAILRSLVSSVDGNVKRPQRRGRIFPRSPPGTSRGARSCR